MRIRAELEERLAEAFAQLSPGADPVLRDSDRADFQANGALPLAKVLGRPPRELAEELVSRARLRDVCSAVEVSGPGFINLTLSPDYLAGILAQVAADDRLGVEKENPPQRVVVDYSAPNVAKEMHIGHLRTTVIGDALCRVLDFLGHDVIRQNHVGDWGTPFGMLIEHLVDIGEDEAVHELSVGDLGGFYRKARASFDADEDFQERSRRRVVLLQSGDPDTLELWHILVAESVRYFEEAYRALGVLLTPDDVVGESFYNPMLPEVVVELRQKGLLVTHDGAQCVFPPGFTNRQGDPLPLIVQKSDGGYGYPATDLAAIRYRVGQLGATLLLYVIGAPQAQHLAMVFAVAKMAGWLPDGPGGPDGPEGAQARHVAFGSVLGPDHKLLRTRSGDVVLLMDVLRDAVERGCEAVESRDHDLGAEEAERLGAAVGIGAVKYADLSTDRNRDYVFDWDRMLAFEGNTGPYLQYAHARICSIFRRLADHGYAEEDPPPGTGASEPLLGDEAEVALAKVLVGFEEAIRATADGCSPNRLTAYLYELASTFTTFYEHCPVLRAPDDDIRHSRLLLCRLSADVLALGLGLLGIEAPDRM